jgi:hypothetical protein
MDQPHDIAENAKNRPAEEAWRRFTLLDLLILFSGHEAALGLMKWYGVIDSAQYVWSRVAVVLFVVLLLGGILSLPALLFVQYVPRRRRSKPSTGEAAAIVTSVFWLFVVLAFRLHFLMIFWFTLFLAGVPFFVFSGYCGLRFFRDFYTTKNDFACFWLSQYGFLLSLLSVLFIVFVSLATTLYY